MRLARRAGSFGLLQHPVDGKAELRYKLFFDETRSEEKLPSTLQIDLYVTR